MNLRLRFALSFSLLVSGILITSLLLVYLLYSESRKEEYHKRLWAQSIHIYGSVHGNDQFSEAVLKEVKNFYPANLVNFRMVILNKNLKIIFARGDTAKTNFNFQFLPKIKKEKEYFFYNKQDECLGLYFNYKGTESYMISCATDRFGKQKLITLRNILGMVTAGGIVLTCFFSFLYVKQAMKPLIQLGEQMKYISENNLKQRIHINPKNKKPDEQWKIAYQFNEMLERLERAFKQQKNFVHHASHELRTPLASMLTQTEAALQKELTATEAREILSSLKEDQHELIELTNSLLILSQYEIINFSEDWPLLRLDEILYETLTMMKRIFPDLNVSLEFVQIPENELYISIHGNDTLLRSAFRNLIKNGYSYSENKTVTIIIDSQPDAIQIDFVNNGKLLTEQEQQQLFIPFFRGINAQQKKGSGLGLSIVRRIIILHKGSVKYSIKNDAENHFTVRFEKLPA